MSGYIKFYIAPGARGDSAAEDKMLRAHEAEAAKRRAKFFNYGWASGRNGICSKTSHGILTTEINTKMEVSHSWK
jgi:hypothetical protein